MPSRWLVGPALGLLLLCTLLVTAPARLLPLLLPARQIVMQGLHGTLWHGSASRVLVATAGGYLHLGRVAWRLRPLSLLLIAPAFELDSAWGGQVLRGELRLRRSGDLEITGLEGRFDAALLRHYIPVNLAGAFAAQLDALTLRQGLPSRVEGRLVWENGGWNSPQGLRPLGSYALDLHTDADGAVRGAVVTLAGELQARGELHWQSGAYALDILLSGPGLGDPQLAQALQLVAAPEGDAMHLKMAGRLSE